VNEPDLQDDIPTLTDIVASGDASSPASFNAQDQNLLKTQQLPTLDAGPSVVEPGPDNSVDEADHEWLEELSLRVQAQVLAGLTARIEPIVERRLQESLTDLLEQVLAGMTAELKVTARNIVRDAVAQAVAAELAALPAHRPGPQDEPVGPGSRN
jgi:acetylglutamate kinase